MADIKKMERVANHLSHAISVNADVPYIPVWIIKEDAEMLVRLLHNKILFEKTYGKEGEP